MTLSLRVSGNWRHRARNVNKAFVGFEGSLDFARDNHTAPRDSLAVLSGAKAQRSLAGLFVDAGARFVLARGKRRQCRYVTLVRGCLEVAF